MSGNKFVFPMELSVGSAAAPSLWFGDAGTGFYRNSTNQIGITVAGVQIGAFSNTGQYQVRYNAQSAFLGYRANGSPSAATATGTGDIFFDFIGYGHNGTAFTPGSGVRFRQDGAVSGAYTPAELVLIARSTAGASTEVARARASGAFQILGALDHDGSTLGFFNTTPTTKPTVTGSRGSNAALTSLLTALAGLGLITNSSS